MRRDEEEEDYPAQWAEHAAGAGPIPNRRERERRHSGWLQLPAVKPERFSTKLLR